MTNLASGQELLAKTIEAFGKIDILVLNAGIMGSRPLADVDERFFDEHFLLNVKAPLFLVKAAAPLLPEGRWNATIISDAELDILQADVLYSCRRPSRKQRRSSPIL
jgi:NAD(P)-dependent dehydrogenase (short-subunit alcohol dehydrogenase family)